MMKKFFFAAVVLVVFACGFSTAQGQYRPILVSLRPQIDIPLHPDQFMFGISGGLGASGSYVFPFFQPLSAGIAVNYHLGPMRHDEMGNLGSLSVISAETTAELRITLLRLIDAYLSGGAGYFYAFLNDDPSSFVTNLVYNGRVGVGLRVNPTITIGIQGEYRRYRSLYHLLGVGLGVDLRLGGTNGSKTDRR
jgi:hypothetical protein